MDDYTLPINAVIVDSSGNVIAGNNCSRCSKCFDFSTDGRGESYLEFCQRCVPGSEKFKDDLSALIAGESESMVLVYPCPSSEKKWCLLIGTPLKLGETRGVSLLHVNITDLLPLSRFAPGFVVEQIEEATKDAITNQIIGMKTLMPSKKVQVSGNSCAAPLTGRQKEVLQGIVKGNSNKEIANEIGISYQTVKIHVSEILRRLKVKNRTEAALAAVANNP